MGLINIELGRRREDLLDSAGALAPLLLSEASRHDLL